MVHPQPSIGTDSTRTVEIEAELDYHDLPETITLCDFTGFTGGVGQRVMIQSPRLNDRVMDMTEFSDLLQLRAQGNPHTPDHVLTNCHEVCFNGRLELVVRANRDRLFWCPAYHSDRRGDFVFNNMFFDRPIESAGIPADVITFSHDPRHKQRVYRNAPHHDHDTQHVYDLAAFGCSVTYGTALSPRDTWPSILSTRPLNLGMAGLGIDGVFLNVQAALRKFRFDRMVLLLSSPHRTVVRLPMPATGGWARISVAPQSDWYHSAFKHWAWQNMGTLHDRGMIEQWRRMYTARAWRLALGEDGDVARYQQRTLARLVRLCERSGVPYHVGSYDEETHGMIQRVVPEPRRLPFFHTQDLAWDSRHPGPASQREWAEQIRPLIRS